MERLAGEYRIINDLHMRKRANQTDDPRYVFYIAGLTSVTYEQYLERVGALTVEPPTHPSSAVNGNREIRWWREIGWIRDA
ncbi:MAG: hypothetical protein KGM42_05050 [Hyphomicrobiales bacterium]|nr:hypothetical protein [Hyphomicrobiales bacterium]